MREIPVKDVKPGYVIRHFFKSDFGLHRIEGQVESLSEERTSTGRGYVRVTLDGATGSDISLNFPGVYLYGRDGLRQSEYSFGLMPDMKVLLLEEGTSVLMPSEISPDAIPEHSIWVWSPGDGSATGMVRVSQYEEKTDGAWVHFADSAGSPWVLDSDAFLEQCTFFAFNEA